MFFIKAFIKACLSPNHSNFYMTDAAQEPETRESIIQKVLICKAQLNAMGVNVDHLIDPKGIDLPEKLEGFGATFENKRKLPDHIMGLKQASEMWSYLQDQIDEKRGELDSYIDEYCSIASSLKARPSLSDTVQLRLRNQAIGIYHRMVSLQSQIQSLQGQQIRFSLGKKLVDEEEWWKEYDSLWQQLWENQQKLIFPMARK